MSTPKPPPKSTLNPLEFPEGNREIINRINRLTDDQLIFEIEAGPRSRFAQSTALLRTALKNRELADDRYRWKAVTTRFRISIGISAASVVIALLSFFMSK